MKNKDICWELEKKLDKLQAENNLLKEDIKILKAKNKQLTSDFSNKNQCDELKDESYLLDVLMDTIPDRIYFKNKKSQFIKISKSLAKRHNIDNVKMAIGKTDFDFFTENYAKKTLLDEQKIIKSGIPVKNIIEKETWSSGDVSWASTTKMPILNKKGDIIGTFGISRDVTDRIQTQNALKKSEVKLRELNATKDKFFSIIAHDLKSPFNTMLGFSNLLLHNFDQYDKKTQKKYLGIIFRDIQNTYKLLENLLLWSYSQQGKIDFDPEEENLYLLSAETIDLLLQSALKKKINLINKISEDILVKSDKNMLLTVLRNLISNAIKFTDKNGEIIINAKSVLNKKDKKFIEIYVQDTGVGIAKNKLGKLLKISEDTSTKGTDGESGTGLGLVLCKDFIKKQGGVIRIESELGKGSKFIFTIPEAV